MSAVAEVLRSSKELLFSSFLKHAPVGLAFCQSPGKILMANAAFHELLGLPADQDECCLSALIYSQDERVSKSNAHQLQ
jgi:PAS domain-containing protein